CQPVWDSPNGPNIPLLPVISEHNDPIITATDTTTITSNAMVTAIHHTFTNAYMQIQPEIQTLAETSSSNNTVDSKKRHHRRRVMKMEDNRSRSLGTHQRGQIQKFYRPIFPTNLATTITPSSSSSSSSSSSAAAAVAAAAVDVSTNLMELPQRSKQTFEIISG
ncbi:unnamed protein product, partial [Acanthocheilonema viteae]